MSDEMAELGPPVGREKSTHKVEVVRLGKIDKHPNADSLGIVHVFDYTVVVRLSDWKEGDLAAYVVPDSLVPVRRPEFAFLASVTKSDLHRVKVKRLRGIFSQGLLIPAPARSVEGDNVASFLGVTRYEPPEPGETRLGRGLAGDIEPPPPGDRAVYDVDSYLRYSECFTPGEIVHVTEKIHGCNARFTAFDGKVFCGSRRQWKKDDPNSVWWKALRKYPGIEELVLSRPVTIYGEVYGVQDLRYGVTPPDVGFAVFDILDPAIGWLSFKGYRELAFSYSIPLVPHLFTGPLDHQHLLQMGEGRSILGDHVREGIVVRPERERWDCRVGRVHLKVVGNGYLERAE